MMFSEAGALRSVRKSAREPCGAGTRVRRFLECLLPNFDLVYFDQVFYKF